MKVRIFTTIWKYHGASAWYFATIPKRTSDQIQKSVSKKRAWGSIKVHAIIGKTSWETSIFRDTKSESYLVPIKKEVRKKENLEDGSKIKLTLTM